jgi:hypothetical protein
LADYLNNDSKPAAKKPIQQAPVPKNTSAKSFQPVIQSQAQHLKMQDIDDDSDEDNHSRKNKKNQQNDDDENEFMAKRPKDESSPE